MKSLEEIAQHLNDMGIPATCNTDDLTVTAVYHCACDQNCSCIVPNGHPHCSCTQQDTAITRAAEDNLHHVCAVEIDLNRVTSIIKDGHAHHCNEGAQHPR